MATETLYVDTWGTDYTAWAGTGSSPYIDSGDGSYITCSTKKGWTGLHGFEATGISSFGDITSIKLQIRGLSATTGNVCDLTITHDNYSTESDPMTVTFSGSVQNLIGQSVNADKNLTDYLTTLAEINSAEVNIKHENNTVQETVYHAALIIEYSAITQYPKTAAGSMQMTPASLVSKRKRIKSVAAGIQLVPSSLSKKQIHMRTVAANLGLTSSIGGAIPGLGAEFVTGPAVEFLDGLDAEFLEIVTPVGAEQKSVAGAMQLTPATTARLYRAKRSVSGQI